MIVLIKIVFYILLVITVDKTQVYDYNVYSIRKFKTICFWSHAEKTIKQEMIIFNQYWRHVLITKFLLEEM